MKTGGLASALVAAVLWFAFWLAASAVVLPAAAAVLGASIIFFLCRGIRSLPPVRRAGARRKVQRLRRQIARLLETHGFPDPDTFAAGIAARLAAKGISPVSPVGERVAELATALYRAEGFATPNEDATLGKSEFDIESYIDALHLLKEKILDPRTFDLLRDTLVETGLTLSRQLPGLLCTAAAATAGNSNGQLSARLFDLFEDPSATVAGLCELFNHEDLRCRGLFGSLRDRLERNLYAMSELPYPAGASDPRKLIPPSKHKGRSEELFRGYLAKTPLFDVLSQPVPFPIPDSVRFEHHWILAGSGHGKTQVLQSLIAWDLERVARGEASIVVIDSQSELIHNISRLKLFAPGQPLEGRLCLIDPTDLEYPPSVNLFDVGMARINKYSPLDRERLMNGAIELYEFVWASLLGAEMTQKQGVIFRFLMRLLLEIPNATLATFRELLEPNGLGKYRTYVQHLDGTARIFFETEFDSPQFTDTKTQVLRRLWGVLENRSFERLLSHPKNKLDLFDELGKGRVILINTASELLKKTGSEVFGRFFLAVLAQAAEERAILLREKRLPTIVYVDECADLVDHNVAQILERMRKFNIGMVLAHQYIGQLTPKLFDSFSANTTTKFVGGVSDKDARAMAHMMRCQPEFIDAQPKGSFAAYIRNVTPRAISLMIRFGLMEALPRMTEREFAAVQDDMRARYATRQSDDSMTPADKMNPGGNSVKADPTEASESW